MRDQHRSAQIIVSDIRGSSRHEGIKQAALARDLRARFDEAASSIGLEIPPGDRMDRGDGEAIVIRTDIDPTFLVAELCRSFVIALEAFDRSRHRTAELRVRMALHQGPITGSPGRWDGVAIVHAQRILDARRLRQSLEDTPQGLLAVGISDSLHEATVKEKLHGLDPADWDRFEIPAGDKGTGIRAWLQVDGRFPPAARSAVDHSARPDPETGTHQAISFGDQSPVASSDRGDTNQTVSYGG